MSVQGERYEWKIWIGRDEFKIEGVPEKAGEPYGMDYLNPTALEELWSALGEALIRAGYDLDVEESVLEAIRKLPVGRDAAP
jgi:hypothetical protein